MLLGSAATGVGIDRLADYICELGPSPLDRPATVIGGTERVPVPADASAAAVAYVFKTVADQFVGQVSLFKVLSGTVRGDDRLVNTHTSAEERLHGLFHLRGKDHVPVNQVVAGDIAAVAKLSATPTHSTLAAKGSPVRVEPPPTAPAAYRLALEPVTQSDDDKLSDALDEVVQRGPDAVGVAVRGVPPDGALRRRRHPPRRRAWNGSPASSGSTSRPPNNRCRTAKRSPRRADAEGKVKKQSGGHGQYAVVNLRVAADRARRR